MGTLGRIFVLMNGFAALTFLMWSIALYTNRVNWFTDKAGNKENVGLVDKFDEQFKARNKTALGAAQRWEKNETALRTVEKERVARREFYRDAIARVTEGKDRTGKMVALPKLVKIMRRDANNIKLDIGPNETYYATGPAPLESMASYSKKIGDARDQLTVQQREATKLVDLYQKLTQEIFGSSNPRVLGLRDVIKEQEAINAGAESGTAYLIPIITERNAQTDIFLERNAVLLDRLTVLEEFLKRSKTSTSIVQE
jgi:hypothetical protein